MPLPFPPRHWTGAEKIVRCGIMSKALAPILALAAIGGAAFSYMQYNARSAAEAAAEERDLRISALEQSMRDAADAAKKAQDELALEKENVARLKRERDDALEKAKRVAASGAPGAPGADGKPQFDLRNALGGFAKAFDDPDQRKAMQVHAGAHGERRV